MVFKIEYRIVLRPCVPRCELVRGKRRKIIWDPSDRPNGHFAHVIVKKYAIERPIRTVESGIYVDYRNSVRKLFVHAMCTNARERYAIAFKSRRAFPQPGDKLFVEPSTSDLIWTRTENGVSIRSTNRIDVVRSSAVPSRRKRDSVLRQDGFFLLRRVSWNADDGQYGRDSPWSTIEI